jgi:hypothetical protein
VERLTQWPYCGMFAMLGLGGLVSPVGGGEGAIGG